MPCEVQVSGPSAVLDELSRAFRQGDNTLTREDDRFVLRSSTFGEAEDARAIRSRADAIVEALSAFSRMQLQSTEPLGVASVTQVRTDGSRHVFLQVEPAVLRISARLASVAVTHADGTVQEYRPSPTHVAQFVHWAVLAFQSQSHRRFATLCHGGHATAPRFDTVWNDID
jgi:hypothetical protein